MSDSWKECWREGDLEGVLRRRSPGGRESMRGCWREGVWGSGKKVGWEGEGSPGGRES